VKQIREKVSPNAETDGRLEREMPIIREMPKIYEIIGTLTVPGNKSNPGVGQSINYSFELDYTQLQFDYPTVVGTPIVTSFGPLGTFSLGNVSSQGYVGFFSSVAEIDLLFQSLSSPPPPVISGQSWLYNCTDVSTGPCAPFYIGPGMNIYGTANASVYAVTTPEYRPICASVRNILSR
jgi:hypothetical protein